MRGIGKLKESGKIPYTMAAEALGGGPVTKPITPATPKRLLTFEEAVTDYYMQYNPTKIGEVPGLVRKYRGREHELQSKMETKYKIKMRPWASNREAASQNGSPRNDTYQRLVAASSESVDDESGGGGKSGKARQAEEALLESLQRAKAKARLQTSREEDSGSPRTGGRDAERSESRKLRPVQSSSSHQSLYSEGESQVHARTGFQTLMHKAALALGPAHALVENLTPGVVCVLTFNKADILLTAYSNMYVLEPGQRLTVEALPDPFGLVVAIVYKAENHFLFYKRWLCRNESEMVVHSVVSMYDMVVTGGLLA
jgi:hypothetical protein